MLKNQRFSKRKYYLLVHSFLHRRDVILNVRQKMVKFVVAAVALRQKVVVGNETNLFGAQNNALHEGQARARQAPRPAQDGIFLLATRHLAHPCGEGNDPLHIAAFSLAWQGHENMLFSVPVDESEKRVGVDPEFFLGLMDGHVRGVNVYRETAALLPDCGGRVD